MKYRMALVVMLVVVNAFADQSVTASSLSVTKTSILLDDGEGRIQGYENCGNYSIKFYAAEDGYDVGTWLIIDKRDGKIIFSGEWSRGCELLWNQDWSRLALTIAWGSNVEDFAVYDFNTKKEIDPHKQVDLGLPKGAEVDHLYMKALRWTKEGDLLFAGEGNWNAKDEQKLRGIQGSWVFKRAGQVKTLKLDIDADVH